MVKSKYDTYWTEQLEPIPAAVELAATGATAKVNVPELRRLGLRQSWYGLAEARGRELTSASSAHAVSLGRTIAVLGICAPWTDRTFRFTIDSSGSAVTITSAEGGRRRSRPLAGERQWSEDPAPTVRTGEAQTPQRSGRAQARRAATVPGDREFLITEFYRLLDELAERTGGPFRLR